MIRVTQGHEKGVGLEIFVKAALCLHPDQQNSLILYCFKDSLIQTLNSLALPFEIKDDELSILSCRINLRLLNGGVSQTSKALSLAIEDMETSDILLTLPSSKDQILSESGKVYKGHTDYFRKIHSNSEVVMSFVSPKLNSLLLTDHISLSQVEREVSPSKFKDIIRAGLIGLRGIRTINKVYIAGVNPHCGENGIISSFDSTLDKPIQELQTEFEGIEFNGLIPGDTILFNPICPEHLFVFPSHDQALAPFKLYNGLTGINLTLGLPYRRVSVDHGTAFDLYGKNTAGYQGMLYLLNEILDWR